MSRRRRPVAVVLAALLSLLTLMTAAAQASAGDDSPGGPDDDQTQPSVQVPLHGLPEQPNIVVIMADDARDDDLQFMPNVRQLIADQGVRFANAFSPQPLCCPARASFLTGEYTHNHHVWSHTDPWGFQAFKDSSTLPVWLDKVGYNTVFLGKYLNGYGRQPLPDGSPSYRYVPPGWTDWRGSVGAQLGPDSSMTGGTYRYFDTTLNVNGRLEPHQGRYQTYLFGDESQEILRAYARSPRPFFYWASFVAPHHGTPAEPDDPKPVRRRDGSLQTFVNPARPASVRGTFDSAITHLPGPAERDVSDKPFFIRDLPAMTAREKAGVLANARQRAEALSVLDDQVGRMMAELRATGELDNTYVVFTSDNGFFLGEHRMRQGKILPYEPSLRVPVVIRGPGIPHGEIRRDPFLTIDFAPTLLAAAGAQAEPTVDGANLLDVARHGDRGWTRGVLTETGPRNVGSDITESDNFLVKKDAPSPLRFSQGVRTPDWLYVEHASHERELYDLRQDPAELTNLVKRPAFAGVVRALAHELDVLRNCKGSGCRQPLPRLLQGP